MSEKGERRSPQRGYKKGRKRNKGVLYILPKEDISRKRGKRSH